MRCEKCNLKDGVDEKDILLDYIKNDCSYCKKVKEKINSYSEIAQIIYEKDIESWLYSNTLVMYEENIIYGNSKEYDLYRASGETKIKDICFKCNIENFVARTKKEKEMVIYKLLGTLYDSLYKIIDINPDAAFIGILTCLEFNRYITAILISGLMKNFINNDTEFSRLGRMINQTFYMLLSCKNFAKQSNLKMEPSFDTIYCDFESQLAFDKLCFEYGIEAIQYRQKLNGKNDNNFNKSNYFEILSLLRAIIGLRSTYVEYIEGYYKNHDLIIINGYMTNVNLFSGYEDNYIENITLKEMNEGFVKHKEEFNKILLECKGFTIDTIIRISESIQKNYLIGDEVLIGNLEIWIKLFMKFGSCNMDEATSVMNEFIFWPDGKIIYSMESRKEKRITRKPIVKYQDMYYSIVDLLIYSLNMYISVLANGDFKDEKLHSKLQSLYKSINDEFEFEIYKLLKQELLIEKIKYNVGQKGIRVKRITIELPGQIDVLAIYDNKIFVIECKNFDLKTESKSVANEYVKLTKESQDSFQIKLYNKIKVIKDNKEIVAEFLGEENPDAIAKEPIGVIVTNMFTMATMAKDIKFNIVTKDKLITWIKNGTNQSS